MRDLGCLEHVMQLQTHARYVILLHTIELLRVCQMDEYQTGIVLEMAGFKNTGNGELLQSRQHACRRHLPLRRNQHQLVPGKYAKRAREFPAYDNTESTRRKVFKFTVDHHAPQVGDPVFHIRHNTSYHDSANHVIE